MLKSERARYGRRAHRSNGQDHVRPSPPVAVKSGGLLPPRLSPSPPRIKHAQTLRVRGGGRGSETKTNPLVLVERPVTEPLGRFTTSLPTGCVTTESGWV
jgi:hypothetical protein